MNMYKILSTLLSLTLVQIYAYKAPQHKTLRSLSMGGAFTAVAEDRNAIFKNPAGLNLMNKLGNYEKRPDLGYYADNWYDMRMDYGFSLPDLTSLYNKANGFYEDHGNTIDSMQVNTTEALKNDTTFYNDALFMDRYPLPLGSQINLELAMHNFGGAIWTDVTVNPFIDAGIMIPSAGIQSVDASLVTQVAGAYEINPYLNVGLGAKAVYTNHMGLTEIDVANASKIDSIGSSIFNNEMSKAKKDIQEVAISYGFDFGTQYQLTREMRVGAALLNYFPGGIRGQDVTPELNLGYAYSPRKFQRNTAYARKVNFAFDLEDLLNDDKNYKFASKINFGAEWEQVWLAIPSVTLGSNARAIATRLAAGFKGGYWSLGGELELMRVIHLQIASWAEETGYFTGQEPNRQFVLSFGLGF
jgi:hypothetical protein